MLWSFVTLTRANPTVITWHQVSAILATGPFRLSRNPTYLADAITYLGGSLAIQSWWPLLIMPGTVLMMRRKVIDREERYLTNASVTPTGEYQLRVRRWL
jgi:protein-S-isoprenylcysteine O-methyltransferase Ste14